jgi:hypothetical protein
MKKRIDSPNKGTPRAAQSGSGGLLDRWWVQLLVTGWMLLVVVAYFRLQLLRLVEIAQR